MIIKDEQNYEKIKKILEASILSDPIKNILINKYGISLKIFIREDIKKLEDNQTKIFTKNNYLGMITISKKPWESSIFKKNIASIDSINITNYDESLLDDLINYVVDWAKENDIYLISYRTENINNQLKKIKKLHFSMLKKKFYFIETYITFINNLNNIDMDTENNNIRLLKDLSNIDEIKSIAKKSFKLDRFHIDPFLDDDLADKTREEWIKNIAKGRGKIFCSFDKNNNINGFLGFKDNIINNELKYSTIELIAVHQDHQGKGIGKNLINNYLQYLKNNKYKFSVVGTQAKNIPSIKLYERTGYEIIDSNYTYHWCIKNE
ncbi:GNAT family N-acetyltransferase [Candidatus Woesearchaeota archaeon]|nr:GNAT family N-acetyltransferase [Candidatus Woesearchaeota archaeon]